MADSLAVVNNNSDQVMSKLIEISERIASVEAKVVSSTDIEKAVDKLEEKFHVRLTNIESDVKRIDQSMHHIEKSSVPKTPIAMKITAISASVAIVIGGFTITNMINENVKNQAKLQYIQHQVESNKNIIEGEVK